MNAEKTVEQILAQRVIQTLEPDSIRAYPIEVLLKRLRSLELSARVAGIEHMQVSIAMLCEVIESEFTKGRVL